MLDEPTGIGAARSNKLAYEAKAQKLVGDVAKNMGDRFLCRIEIAVSKFFVVKRFFAVNFVEAGVSRLGELPENPHLSTKTRCSSKKKTCFFMLTNALSQVGAFQIYAMLISLNSESAEYDDPHYSDQTFKHHFPVLVRDI